MKKDYLGIESVVNFAMSAGSIGVASFFIGDKKVSYREDDVENIGWK